jgi:transposase
MVTPCWVAGGSTTNLLVMGVYQASAMAAKLTGAARKITRLHRRVASIRSHHIHALTTRLAKTHGEIVVEGLDAAGMLRQKGLPGARARRRGLSDSALGQTRRQLYRQPSSSRPD